MTVSDGLSRQHPLLPGTTPADGKRATPMGLEHARLAHLWSWERQGARPGSRAGSAGL